MKAWLKIIMCRRSRNGYPCLKDQLNDLIHIGKMTFGRYIKSRNICNWKKVAQNRDNWKKVVEQARTLHRM